MAAEEYFSDPRLARLYDTLCDARDDTEFYLALAEGIGATMIIDIGCGTGLLATELAGRGHQVTGVDPSRSMLAVARSRPGHDQVSWIDGDATAVPALGADLAIMTGHVAQVFLDDVVWMQALHAVHRVLGPGGRLAFESRHPAAQAWLRCFDTHHRFLASGEDVVSCSTLRFRELDRLTESLTGQASPWSTPTGTGIVRRSPRRAESSSSWRARSWLRQCCNHFRAPLHKIIEKI